MSLLKSLLITGVFPPQVGGSGRWLWELYRRLPREQRVILAGDYPSAKTFDADNDPDVRRMPLKFADLGYFEFSGFVKYRSIARKVNRIVQQESIDAIHCGALLPDAWIGRLVARRWRLPLLTYMHGEETCYANSSRQLDWMGRRILRDSTRIIANSENTATILKERWNVRNDRVRILHPGVDCDKFTPASRDESTRRKLGWNDRLVVLTVGRLQERKGQDTLIRALPKIAERLPTVLYAIAGDGQDFSRLNSLAQEVGVADRVQFYRNLSEDELIRTYQQCDLFVLPNRRVGDDIEGFGMVLLEAQACGKPVLAGASGGTAETMLVGETGFVLDCSACEPLAQTVVELLRDHPRREAMGRAGRTWAESHFDWPVLTRIAEAIHAELQ